MSSTFQRWIKGKVIWADFSFELFLCDGSVCHKLLNQAHSLASCWGLNRVATRGRTWLSLGRSILLLQVITFMMAEANVIENL